MVGNATGEIDVPELVHMQDTQANEIGIPGAYDWLPAHVLASESADELGGRRWLHRTHCP
ncbi:MAG: hypothetical protein EPO21_01685 [Chloroflexota bacterium]|nr:MAG: hypothetical protein EPO21_01685 [Chloroflexota bacterium]